MRNPGDPRADADPAVAAGIAIPVNEPVVVDNAEASRFELHIDDELAGRVDYLPAGDSVIVAHTEVADGHEGEGLGGVLVRAALEGIQREGQDRRSRRARSRRPTSAAIRSSTSTSSPRCASTR